MSWACSSSTDGRGRCGSRLWGSRLGRSGQPGLDLAVDPVLQVHLPELLLRRGPLLLPLRRALLCGVDTTRDRRGRAGDDGGAGNRAQQSRDRAGPGRTPASCPAPVHRRGRDLDGQGSRDVVR